ISRHADTTFILLLYLFFYSHGHHRYLLSFPTRRSSDLFVDDGPGKPVGINRFIGRRPVFAFGNSDGDQQMLEYTAGGEGARFMGDRKSTRLNSSHLVISYAVFCLKKKN